MLQSTFCIDLVKRSLKTPTFVLCLPQTSIIECASRDEINFDYNFLKVQYLNLQSPYHEFCTLYVYLKCIQSDLVL
jgi:hypothetical protein